MVTDVSIYSMDCGELGGTISAIEFASYGTPTSHCGHQGTYKCHADASAQVSFIHVIR